MRGTEHRSCSDPTLSAREINGARHQQLELQTYEDTQPETELFRKANACCAASPCEQ